MDRLISLQAAIDALGEKPLAWTEGEYELGLQNQWQSDVDTLKALPSAQPEPQWIPIKTRPMTDGERDYWIDHFGYDVRYENDIMFDCKMPEDQQPVWVQSNYGYIYEDVCKDDNGMLGLEGNGDWSDIVAWMPKYVPEPWKGEQDG